MGLALAAAGPIALPRNKHKAAPVKGARTHGSSHARSSAASSPEGAGLAVAASEGDSVLAMADECARAPMGAGGLAARASPALPTNSIMAIGAASPLRQPQRSTRV